MAIHRIQKSLFSNMEIGDYFEIPSHDHSYVSGAAYYFNAKNPDKRLSIEKIRDDLYRVIRVPLRWSGSHPAINRLDPEPNHSHIPSHIPSARFDPDPPVNPLDDQQPPAIDLT